MHTLLSLSFILRPTHIYNCTQQPPILRPYSASWLWAGNARNMSRHWTSIKCKWKWSVHQVVCVYYVITSLWFTVSKTLNSLGDEGGGQTYTSRQNTLTIARSDSTGHLLGFSFITAYGMCKSTSDNTGIKSKSSLGSSQSPSLSNMCWKLFP
jgi:hypothetical protein